MKRASIASATWIIAERRRAASPRSVNTKVMDVDAIVLAAERAHPAEDEDLQWLCTELPEGGMNVKVLAPHPGHRSSMA